MTQNSTSNSFPHVDKRGTLRPVNPPQPPNPTKKHWCLRIKVDDELLVRLTKLSQREFLELNTYVRQALCKHVAAHDPQREPDR